MKLGIIGFSNYFRRVYMPYLKSRKDDVELLVICDILNIDALPTNLLQKSDFNTDPVFFTDVHTMLNSIDLDAVIISTPHVFHFEQAKACLQAGLHVFVDKPLACRYKDAQELVKIANQKGLKLAVGNQRRYESTYIYVKQAIVERRLGEIRAINYLFANSPWYDYSKSWRGNPALSGGGALIDIGYLAIDMLIWLLEKPLQRVYASASVTDLCCVEQSVAIIAEFNPNILVNFMITYEPPIPSVQEELSIYGSTSCIFIKRFQPHRSTTPPSIIEQSRANEIKQLHFTDIPDNSKPLDDFLNGIENGTIIKSDGNSSLPTLELIEHAYSSIQNRMIVNIGRNQSSVPPLKWL